MFHRFQNMEITRDNIFLKKIVIFNFFITAANVQIYVYDKCNVCICISLL